MNSGQKEMYPSDCSNTLSQPRMLTIKEQLDNKRIRLELELLETTRAMKSLEDNPEVANCFELVSKALGRL